MALINNLFQDLTYKNIKAFVPNNGIGSFDFEFPGYEYSLNSRRWLARIKIDSVKYNDTLSMPLNEKYNISNVFINKSFDISTDYPTMTFTIQNDNSHDVNVSLGILLDLFNPSSYYSLKKLDNQIGFNIKYSHNMFYTLLLSDDVLVTDVDAYSYLKFQGYYRDVEKKFWLNESDVPMSNGEFQRNPEYFAFSWQNRIIQSNKSQKFTFVIMNGAEEPPSLTRNEFVYYYEDNEIINLANLLNDDWTLLGKLFSLPSVSFNSDPPRDINYILNLSKSSKTYLRNIIIHTTKSPDLQLSDDTLLYLVPGTIKQGEKINITGKTLDGRTSKVVYLINDEEVNATDYFSNNTFVDFANEIPIPKNSQIGDQINMTMYAENIYGYKSCIITQIFTLEKFTPQITNVELPDNESYFPNETLNIFITAKNFSEIHYFANLSDYALQTLNESPFSFKIPENITSGTYNLIVYGIDKDGNFTNFWNKTITILDIPIKPEIPKIPEKPIITVIPPRPTSTPKFTAPPEYSYSETIVFVSETESPIIDNGTVRYIKVSTAFYTASETLISLYIKEAEEQKRQFMISSGRLILLATIGLAVFFLTAGLGVGIYKKMTEVTSGQLESESLESNDGYIGREDIRVYTFSDEEVVSSLFSCKASDHEEDDIDFGGFYMMQGEY